MDGWHRVWVRTYLRVGSLMMEMMLTLSIGGAISRSEGRWPDLMNWISTWDNRKLGSDHHHQNENDDLEWFGRGGVREKAEDFHFKSFVLPTLLMIFAGNAFPTEVG